MSAKRGGDWGSLVEQRRDELARWAAIAPRRRRGGGVNDRRARGQVVCAWPAEIACTTLRFNKVLQARKRLGRILDENEVRRILDVKPRRGASRS